LEQTALPEAANRTHTRLRGRGEHANALGRRHLGDLDQRVLDWASGPDFDRLIVDTVTATYPEHEHERFIAHFRGLTSL
jgi:hypothetical protein